MLAVEGGIRVDQIRIGAFLKELRREKELTQEQLAEELGVSGRTVSRWETGNNMPDIGMLVELADFYDVSIPEIVAGERKSETMDKETRETAAAMAEYSHNEVKAGKLKMAGCLAAAFGVFIIISAMAMFPSESSWGSIYATLGSIILLVGIWFLTRDILVKKRWRALAVAGCALVLFGLFSVSDYLLVTTQNQVPRFRYIVSWDSREPDNLVYKTLFFTAVRENRGTREERVYIVK